MSKKEASKGDDSKRRIGGAKKALAEEAKSQSSSHNSAPVPQLHTPASADVSGANTPSASSSSSSPTPTFPDGLSSLWEEADDEILHCVAMNEMCIKIGRITVPPVLALAAAGCSAPGAQNRWAEITKLRAGNGKAMRELLKGGWRNVPEGERWWEDALAGFEEQRLKRLRMCKGMKDGTEGLQRI